MERLTLDDMIKALRCVASQDREGDCYADHENFMHMEDDENKRIVCETGEDLRDYISGKEAVGCPYHQSTYGCCFEDGESYWLKDVAELLEELKSYKDLEEHLHKIFGEESAFSLADVIDALEMKLSEPDKKHPVNARILTYEEANKWEEYKDLEEHGLLVKLPCKVGDMVWDNDFGYPESYEIKAFSYGYCDSYVEPSMGIEDEIIFYYENYNGSITGAFPMSEIGKSVFLTREEAKKKLEEMKNDKT
jgi:hypothetical protein